MEAAITFGLQFVGAPYCAWDGTVVGWTNDTPFWCGPGPLPSVEQVQKDGVCCTGLLNLMVRAVGGRVPEWDGWVGDTSAWGQELATVTRREFTTASQRELATVTKRELTTVNRGDIMFRPWRYGGPDDQGHVAICLDEKGTILHSYSGRGVVVEPMDVEYYVWRIPGVEFWTSYARIVHVS